MGKLVGGKVDTDQSGLMSDMEDVAVEEEDEKVEEVEKLGRLKYKLEYDFNSTHVNQFIIHKKALHIFFCFSSSFILFFL